MGRFYGLKIRAGEMTLEEVQGITVDISMPGGGEA